MKNKNILILLLFLLPLMGITSCDSSEKEDKEIDFENAFIVDVRTPEEYNEGTFKDAVNIPISTVENNIKEFEGKDQIVVFCKSGTRSGKAIKILEKHGITNTVNGVNQEHLESLENQN